MLPVTLRSRQLCCKIINTCELFQKLLTMISSAYAILAVDGEDLSDIIALKSEDKDVSAVVGVLELVVLLYRPQTWMSKEANL